MSRPTGPYFVIDTCVYRHWPESQPGAICAEERQWGPDFVERYTSKRAAQRDADSMNRDWAARQAQGDAEEIGDRGREDF